MQCCGLRARCLETRKRKLPANYRRYECTVCSRRISTIEVEVPQRQGAAERLTAILAPYLPSLMQEFPMSSFDPTSFLNASVQGQMDTTRTPVPMGEYNAYIDKIDYKSFPISKGDRAGETFHKLEVLCKIMAPGNEEADGRVVRKDCILDISNGALDVGKGKNVDLGQLREATGLNDPSQPFAPNMLVGRSIRILVAHEPDAKNPGVMYPRVSRVARPQ